MSSNGLVDFAMKSGMVFEGTTGMYERICRFNPKKERKSNMRIRNGLKDI